MNTRIIAWNIFIHSFALAAFFSASLQNISVFLLLYFLFHGIGIEVGYHRLLAHRSFSVPRWLSRIIGTLGLLCMQGGPIQWVAHHRLHHRNSDQPGDPHNASVGFWHAHWLWFLKVNPELLDRKMQYELVPDLAADPYFRFLDHWQVHLLLQILVAVPLYFFGGVEFVLWGCFVRLVASNHFTFFVNSASHFYGYRTFATKDLSRNNVWVALVTWGDGWHNNHHAFPDSARVGFKWWELDPGYWIISGFRVLGLAKNVKSNLPATCETYKQNGWAPTLDASKSSEQECY